MGFEGTFPGRECDSGSNEVSVRLEEVPTAHWARKRQSLMQRALSISKIRGGKVGAYLRDLKSGEKAWRSRAPV